MKVSGWESLLHAHILEARSKTFEWGQHDCVLWSADWIAKATGVDLAEHYRGSYSSEEEATLKLQSLGFPTVNELASHFLDETPVKKAQRGDIMLHPTGVLGICEGAHAYFVMEAGATRIPFTTCTKAWRVA